MLKRKNNHQPGLTVTRELQRDFWNKGGVVLKKKAWKFVTGRKETFECKQQQSKPGWHWHHSADTKTSAEARQSILPVGVTSSLRGAVAVTVGGAAAGTHAWVSGCDLGGVFTGTQRCREEKEHPQLQQEVWANGENYPWEGGCVLVMHICIVKGIKKKKKKKETREIFPEQLVGDTARKLKESSRAGAWGWTWQRSVVSLQWKAIDWAGCLIMNQKTFLNLKMTLREFSH